jgi:hypothetical protein
MPGPLDTLQLDTNELQTPVSDQITDIEGRLAGNLSPEAAQAQLVLNQSKLLFEAAKSHPGIVPSVIGSLNNAARDALKAQKVETMGKLTSDYTPGFEQSLQNQKASGQISAAEEVAIRQGRAAAKEAKQQSVWEDVKSKTLVSRGAGLAAAGSDIELRKGVNELHNAEATSNQIKNTNPNRNPAEMLNAVAQMPEIAALPQSVRGPLIEALRQDSVKYQNENLKLGHERLQKQAEERKLLTEAGALRWDRLGVVLKNLGPMLKTALISGGIGLIAGGLIFGAGGAGIGGLASLASGTAMTGALAGGALYGAAGGGLLVGLIGAGIGSYASYEKNVSPQMDRITAEQEAKRVEAINKRNDISDAQKRLEIMNLKLQARAANTAGQIFVEARAVPEKFKEDIVKVFARNITGNIESVLAQIQIAGAA